jgi:hypothetical protein
MGVTSGAGIAYPSKEPGFNSVVAGFVLLSRNYEFVPRSGETISISIHLGSLCFVYLIYSFFSTFCNNKKLENSIVEKAAKQRVTHDLSQQHVAL